CCSARVSGCIGKIGKARPKRLPVSAGLERCDPIPLPTFGDHSHCTTRIFGHWQLVHIICHHAMPNIEGGISTIKPGLCDISAISVTRTCTVPGGRAVVPSGAVVN